MGGRARATRARRAWSRSFHRDAEAACGNPDRAALNGDGSEHHDEHDLVDPAGLAYASLDRKRREQDRDGTLEPSPRDKCALAVPKLCPQEQRPCDDGPDDQRENRC